MNDLSFYMRIGGLKITDEEVRSRQSAIKLLVAAWKKERSTSLIVSTASQIAEAISGDGTPSSDLGEKVQEAIQKASPSFQYEDRVFDVGICAALAMVSILDDTPTDNGWTVSDVYAVALWSALSYQPKLEDDKREKLRMDLLNVALKWSTASAEKARERINVPDPSNLEIIINEDNVASHNFPDVMKTTINALGRNAVLDREELDFLWWAQLGRSRLLNMPLSKISEPVRIVSAGIEGAKILRRLPCEVNREIVLRTLEKNSSFDLPELVSEIGGYCEVLGNVFPKDSVLKHPTVFPLLHALNTGATEIVGSSLKRPLSEWGARALLESTFVKMISHGAGKI